MGRNEKSANIELTKLEVEFLVQVLKACSSELDAAADEYPGMLSTLPEMEIPEALDILKSRDGINGETDSSNT